MKGTKLPVINRSVNAVPVWYHQMSGDFPTSEQRSQYVTHKLSKSMDFGPRISYEISKIPFDDFSEQRANYVSYSTGNRNLIRRRDQIQLSKMPILSSTNYGDDFKNKDYVKLSPFRPNGSQLEFIFSNNENIALPMSSLYQSDFHKMEKDVINKKVVSFKEKRINNQGSSTDYQENFQRKPPTRIFLPYPFYKTPKVAFATDTSYNLTFIKHPYSKEGMIMPLKSNLTFSDAASKDLRSTYRTDFIQQNRDQDNDELNIYRNDTSLMQNITHGNWYDKAPSEDFNEYRNHFFYQT